MKNRRGMHKTTIYFILICVITFLFVISPLLFRIAFIYELASRYLSVFKSVDFKSTYIEALGAILGAFLAITGAIWTQNIANKYEKKNKTEKDTLIIYYDFKFAMDGITEILAEIYPLIKKNSLPEDEAIINQFRKTKSKHKIYIDSNWRQLVAEMQDELSVDELREAQIMYSRLSMISMNLNTSVSETSRKSDKDAYALMIEMCDIEESKSEGTVSYGISFDKKALSLIRKLKIIAHIDEA